MFSLYRRTWKISAIFLTTAVTVLAWAALAQAQYTSSMSGGLSGGGLGGSSLGGGSPLGGTSSLGGTSLGGSAALYVSLTRPDLFGLALIESPNLGLGNGQLLRDTQLVARAPDRITIGVGTTELNLPGVDGYLGSLRLTRAEAEAGGVAMNETLASNLSAAFIKKPKVKLVIQPGANHSSESWAQRIPDAIHFLYGAIDTAH